MPNNLFRTVCICVGIGITAATVAEAIRRLTPTKYDPSEDLNAGAGEDELDFDVHFVDDEDESDSEDNEAED